MTKLSQLAFLKQMLQEQFQLSIKATANTQALEVTQSTANFLEEGFCIEIDTSKRLCSTSSSDSIYTDTSNSLSSASTKYKHSTSSLNLSIDIDAADTSSSSGLSSTHTDSSGGSQHNSSSVESFSVDITDTLESTKYDTIYDTIMQAMLSESADVAWWDILNKKLPLRVLVPRVIDALLNNRLHDANGQYLPANLTALVNEIEQEFPKPKLLIENDTKRQRRLDSLARLLTPSPQYTTCVAVTMYKGQLIIATNFPKDKALTEQLQQFLLRKLESIQKFLSAIERGFSQESFPDQAWKKKKISDLKFTPRAKLLAEYLSRDLTDDKKTGGHLSLMSADNSKSRKKGEVATHLAKALLKIGAYFLLGKHQNEDGFTPREQHALLNSEPIILFSQDPESQETMHAEQELIKYLKSDPDFGTIVQEQGHQGKQGIGISMLTCVTCNDVFKRQSNFFTTPRGTHGIRYPNVHAYGATEGEIEVGVLTTQQTSMAGKLYADDSASDLEEETFEIDAIAGGAKEEDISELTLKGLGLDDKNVQKKASNLSNKFT